MKRCSRNQVPEPLVSMKEWPGGQAVTLGPAGTSHREEGYTWYKGGGRREKECCCWASESVGGGGGVADHKENRPIRERTAGLGRGQMTKASQVMAESGFHLFRWQRGTH